MSVNYELWDLETGNLLEGCTSEDEALVAVREYAALEGPAYLDVFAHAPSPRRVGHAGLAAED